MASWPAVPLIKFGAARDVPVKKILGTTRLPSEALLHNVLQLIQIGSNKENSFMFFSIRLRQLLCSCSRLHE